MATFTSVQSGYWNNPSTWDRNAVPADGDTVIVSSGHTVIFNVDQSGFATGLAGLTINGTLKIPSKAEDGSMPNFVCLKVNANIAGSGSLLIGTEAYPIAEPQIAQVMVNGSITCPTVQCYGQARTPLFDYLAQDAPQGSTTVVLLNGLPLQAGDTIVIGRTDTDSHASTSEPGVFVYTVSSYDPATKTVTLQQPLNPARNNVRYALDGNAPICGVMLMTRPIKFVKYGGNSVTNLITTTTANCRGCSFEPVIGATRPTGWVVAGTFHQCAFLHNEGYYAYADSDRTSFKTFTQCTIFGRIGVWGYHTTIQDCMVINAWVGLMNIHAYSPQTTPIKFINVFLQNSENGLWYGANAGFATHVLFQNCRIVAVYFVNDPAPYSIIDGCKFYSITTRYHPAVVTLSDRGAHLLITNSKFFGRYILHGDATAIISDTEVVNPPAISYATLIIAGRYVKRLTGRLLPSGIHICTQRGGVGCVTDSVFYYANPSAEVSFGRSLVGQVFYRNIKAIDANGEYTWNFIDGLGLRYEMFPDPISFRRDMSFADVQGFNDKPKFWRRMFYYGYAENGWNLTPADYNKFFFKLVRTDYAGPVYLDWKVGRNVALIEVRGTIAQMQQGEVVKVQIFQDGKEPLIDDTPDFEETFTTTGEINIVWAPPVAATWIVRVLAYLQQTTDPIVIEDLHVSGKNYFITEPLVINIVTDFSTT